MFSVRFSVFWPAVNSAAPKTAIPVPTSVQGRGTANGRVIGLQPPAPFLPPKSPPLLSTVWEMAGAGIPGELGRLSLQQRSSGGSRARPSVPAGEDGAGLRPAVPTAGPEALGTRCSTAGFPAVLPAPRRFPLLALGGLHSPCRQCPPRGARPTRRVQQLGDVGVVAFEAQHSPAFADLISAMLAQDSSSQTSTEALEVNDGRR